MEEDWRLISDGFSLYFFTWNNKLTFIIIYKVLSLFQDPSDVPFCESFLMTKLDFFPNEAEPTKNTNVIEVGSTAST